MDTTSNRKSYASYLSGVCQVCYRNGVTEAHHIVPVSLGGPDALNNLVELCLECHSLVHNHRASWRKKARDGIQKAKDEGKYRGRKPILRQNLPTIQKLIASGMSKEKVAKTLNINRSSVYRLLKEANEDSSNGYRNG
jgi:DNA-binding NtrC family response regulator